MNSVAEAAGLPVGLAPVGVIQIRDDDSLAGGGMQELAILDEDADVLGAAAGVEKHQIARLQAMGRDGSAEARLLAGVAWQFEAKAFTESQLHESGAVDAASGLPATAGGDAAPLLILLERRRAYLAG